MKRRWYRSGQLFVVEPVTDPPACDPILQVFLQIHDGCNRMTVFANTVYTAIASGGLTLAIAGITGLFGNLQLFFTRRVVGVVLLLITFSLMPTILNLITDPNSTSSQTHLMYALILISAKTLTCPRRLVHFLS
jgi:xanthine/uracil permease